MVARAARVARWGGGAIWGLQPDFFLGLANKKCINIYHINVNTLKCINVELVFGLRALLQLSETLATLTAAAARGGRGRGLSETHTHKQEL